MSAQRQVLLALLLLSAAVAPVAGAPPPGVVCDACGTSFETAADRHGVDLDVSHSTATLQVHANGSGTWTTTNRVADADALQPLRENETLLRAIVTEDVNHGIGAMDEDPDRERITSTSVDETTVTVTVHDPSVARRTPGGTLVVDVFHTAGSGSGWRVNVDRFTVTGPPGTVVASDAVVAIGPDHASVDGRTLTVEGALDGSVGFEQKDVFIAFAPDGPATGLLGALGVAFAWTPILVDRFAVIYALGALLLVAGLAGIHLRRRHGNAENRRRVTAWAAGALVVYLTVVMLAVPHTSAHSMLAGLVTGIFAAFALVVAAGSWFAYPD